MSVEPGDIETETLTEALWKLGFHHDPGACGKRRIIRIEGGECVGWMSSTQGWEYVHALRRGDLDAARYIEAEARQSQSHFETRDLPTDDGE